MLPKPEFKGSKRHGPEPVRLLLLEDDAGFADLISTQLRRMPALDARLEVVGTLAAALAKLANERFGLVLADLHLPDSAGLQTVEALCRAGDQLIIVLTGNQDPALRADAIEYGAYDFLSKDNLSAAALERLVRLASLQANAFSSLRESESRFRSLTELSADMYWQQDAEYRFTEFSGTTPQRIKSGRRQMIGKRRWDRACFNMSEADWARHRATLDTRQPFRDLELGRINEAGEKVWVSVSGEPVFDASGAFTGYRGVGRDISERMASQEALRDSEARFRSLTELTADFHWETDAQHRVLMTTFGTKHRPINADGGPVGKARWDMASTRPDAAGWAAHRATLDAHLPFRDFELARLDTDGVERHLSLSGEPLFDAAGAFTGYRGIGREITARKREAELLRLEHTVARCLSEADSVSAALRAVIRAICETQSWECGRYFGWDERASGLLLQEFWHVPSAALEALILKSRALSYHSGSGLIGQAYRSGQPLWVTDLASDPRVKSGLARDAGMHGAFLFAAISEGKPIGVFVFHSRQVREPDNRLLEAVRVIDSQVGQFVKRRHAESQRHEMELQFRRTCEGLPLADLNHTSTPT